MVAGQVPGQFHGGCPGGLHAWQQTPRAACHHPPSDLCSPYPYHLSSGQTPETHHPSPASGGRGPGQPYHLPGALQYAVLRVSVCANVCIYVYMSVNHPVFDGTVGILHFNVQWRVIVTIVLKREKILFRSINHNRFKLINHNRFKYINHNRFKYMNHNRFKYMNHNRFKYIKHKKIKK